VLETLAMAGIFWLVLSLEGLIGGFVHWLYINHFIF
jgi:hypothetical protein